jgi:chromosome segregation ATPase
MGLLDEDDGSAPAPNGDAAEGATYSERLYALERGYRTLAAQTEYVRDTVEAKDDRGRTLRADVRDLREQVSRARADVAALAEGQGKLVAELSSTRTASAAQHEATRAELAKMAAHVGPSAPIPWKKIVTAATALSASIAGLSACLYQIAKAVGWLP